MSKPTLLIIDGSSYLYRAYHGFPPLANKRNEPTGAIYGVLVMLKKLLHKTDPSHCVVTFDDKAKTFRHELYPDYKKDRMVMPEDLQQQLPVIKELLTLMGLTVVSEPGVEADDVIGTYAKLGKGSGFKVLIGTSDKDMAQLVDYDVSMIVAADSTLGVTGVREYYGVPPHAMVDYLALTGDKVDGIPGVHGVGKKTSLMLLLQFGSLEGIYDGIEDVPRLPIPGAKRVKQLLLADKDNAYLSKQLATIKTDVTITTPLCDLVKRNPDRIGFAKLLKHHSITMRNFDMSMGIFFAPVLKENVEGEIVINSPDMTLEESGPYYEEGMFSVYENCYELLEFIVKSAKAANPDCTLKEETVPFGYMAIDNQCLINLFALVRAWRPDDDDTENASNKEQLEMELQGFLEEHNFETNYLLIVTC